MSTEEDPFPQHHVLAVTEITEKEVPPLSSRTKCSFLFVPLLPTRPSLGPMKSSERFLSLDHHNGGMVRMKPIAKEALLADFCLCYWKLVKKTFLLRWTPLV